MRAERFHFEKDRARNLIARGFLRVFLGRYLGVAPERLVLEQTSQGKPFLKDFPGTLQFNLSHSHDTALYGFCRHAKIGVDLEHMGRGVNEESIARNYFTPEESAAILQEQGEKRRALFYRYWTLKEAYLKATGEGLAVPLHQFRISLDSLKLVPVGLLSEKGNTSPVDWSFHQWIPREDYVAALAVEGKNFSYLFKDAEEFSEK